MVDPATERVFAYFGQLSEIPRPSKKEGKVKTWLESVAKEHDWVCRKDNEGNVVLVVPASPGREQEPVVVLQGHQDMVCEKTPDSAHDFERDPIQLRVDGEWLTAHDTTLGADNGIAIALALALSTDPDVSRPPLELLFTVDEETGLTGANRLDPSLLHGRILLNIDSEDEGVLTVGCAGGTDTGITMNLTRSPLGASWSSYRLSVSGLKGGHSGVDIHLKRANANVILAHALRCITDTESISLLQVSGGSAHNAIPRDAHAVFATGANIATLERIVGELETQMKRQYGTWEPRLEVRVAPEESAEPGVSAEHTRQIAQLLCALPHGIQAMSGDIPGLVETSVNLATVKSEHGSLKIGLSQRSSVQEEMEMLSRRIHSIGALAGVQVTDRNSYPGWKPDMQSRLLERCRSVYAQTFGVEPVVEAIHAGLECGVIGAKYDAMDMISLGPTIQGPHSPDERLHIASVGKVYRLLREVLASKAG